jgi:hypothetical protein
MSSAALALATWWSLTDANATLLGVVVAVVGVAALGVVGHRLWTRRR